MVKTTVPELTADQKLNLRELQLKELSARHASEKAQIVHQGLAQQLGQAFVALEVADLVLDPATLVYKPKAE